MASSHISLRRRHTGVRVSCAPAAVNVLSSQISQCVTRYRRGGVDEVQQVATQPQ